MWRGVDLEGRDDVSTALTTSDIAELEAAIGCQGSGNDDLIRCSYQKFPPNQPNCGGRTIATLGAGRRLLAILVWRTGFNSRIFVLAPCDWSADIFNIAKAFCTLLSAGTSTIVSGAQRNSPL